MIKSGIYQIVNRVTGRCYIGSTVDFDGRWKSHCKDLDRGKHVNPKLQAAWNKYGEEAFRFRIVEFVPDLGNLHTREQHYLDTRKPEYNICKIAGSVRGLKWTKKVPVSDEHRKNLSLALKNRTFTPEWIAKMSAAAKARKASPETRAKMSASMKGKPFSDSHRAKLKANKLAFYARRREQVANAGA